MLWLLINHTLQVHAGMLQRWICLVTEYIIQPKYLASINSSTETLTYFQHFSLVIASTKCHLAKRSWVTSRMSTSLGGTTILELIQFTRKKASRWATRFSTNYIIHYLSSFMIYISPLVSCSWQNFQAGRSQLHYCLPWLMYRRPSMQHRQHATCIWILDMWPSTCMFTRSFTWLTWLIKTTLYGIPLQRKAMAIVRKSFSDRHRQRIWASITKRLAECDIMPTFVEGNDWCPTKGEIYG